MIPLGILASSVTRGDSDHLLPPYDLVATLVQPIAPDPDWLKVTSLLHFDGTQGSSSFIDQVGSPWAIVSATPKLTTDYPKFGTASLSATGVIRNSNALGSGIGTQDFTIEGWFNAGSQNSRGLFDSVFNSSASGVALGHENIAGGQWQVYFGGAVNSVSNKPLLVGVYSHFALVRLAGVVTLYIDGLAILSFSSSGNIGGSSMHIGGYYNSTFIWNGRIDEFRITIGSARYTGNFQVPAEPFPDFGPI